MANEVAKQICFHHGQLQGALSHVQLERVEVDDFSSEQITVLAGGGRAVFRPAHPLGAAQQAANAGDQDGQLERLRQVIVRPGGKPVQHVLGAIAGGQYQYGNELAGVAQFGDDRESVFAWQHHVEHHQVEPAPRVHKRLERAFAGVDDFHFVALGLEIEAQAGGEVLLILNNQDSAHVYCGGAVGSCRVKVLPRPAPWLSA